MADGGTGNENMKVVRVGGNGGAEARGLIRGPARGPACFQS